MEINWKSNRYVPFFHEIKKDFELTSQETEVYGHLYNICINLNQYKNDSGWCGYSNQTLSEYTGIGLTQLKLYLKNLNDKGLIRIENKQSPMRKIYLTSKPFIQHRQTNLQDMEIERLENENNELKARLSDLERDSNDWWHNNPYLSKLKALGLLRIDEMERAEKELTPIYNEITNYNSYGFTNMGKHFSYIAKEYNKTTVHDNVAWLKTAAETYFKRLTM